MQKVIEIYCESSFIHTQNEVSFLINMGFENEGPDQYLQYILSFSVNSTYRFTTTRLFYWNQSEQKMCLSSIPCHIS